MMTTIDFKKSLTYRNFTLADDNVTILYKDHTNTDRIGTAVKFHTSVKSNYNLTTHIDPQTFEIKTVYKHRVLWELWNQQSIPSSSWIDHIDRNRQNNSRENLRICTPTQNLLNRAQMLDDVWIPYRGVTKCKIDDKFMYKARICGRDLGVFDSILEAKNAVMHRIAQIHPNFTIEV